MNFIKNTGKLFTPNIINYVAAVSFAFAYRYDPWYRTDTQRPVDVITDVINDLGIRILQQYSGHGNVAFSPTGVAFVLASLYEGSAGRGCQQIVEAVGLPSRDVTRIGFRDIHRRLRVRSRKSDANIFRYFVQKTLLIFSFLIFNILLNIRYKID